MSDGQEFDFIYNSQDSIENELNEFYAPLDEEQEEQEEPLLYFKKLLHDNLKSGNTDDIKLKTREIVDIPFIFQKIRDNLHDKNCMGLFYNILIFNSLKDVNILDFLKELFKFEQLAKILGESPQDLKSLKLEDMPLKDVDFMVKRCLVLHKLLKIFTKDVQEIKKDKRKEYGLKDPSVQKVGVEDYKYYQKELLNRYPGYFLEDLHELKEEYPGCLRRRIDEIPRSLHPYTEREYLPKGIKDIKEILLKNLYISAGTFEKTGEKKSNNWKIREFGDLYKSLYPNLGKIVSILRDILHIVIHDSNLDFRIPNSEYNIMSMEERRNFINDAIKQRSKLVLCKAVSGILWMLLKIFKVHHVLEFEHFCMILVEQNCHVIFLKFLVSWFPGTANLLKMEQEKKNKFLVGEHWLKHRNELAQLDFFTYSQKENVLSDLPDVFKDLKSSNGDSASSETSASLSESRKSCYASFYSTCTFFKILQKITKRKYCRLLHLNQLKTYNVLKRIILINNRDLQYEALKVLKSQIPFLGKKWRMQNMNVISTMYRILPSKLLDDTLSVDLEINPAESAKDENKLREMVCEYNSKLFEIEKVPASSVSSSKNDLDLLLVLSRYSTNAEIPDTCDLAVPEELDSHFKENYKSWLLREVFLDNDISEIKV